MARRTAFVLFLSMICFALLNLPTRIPVIGIARPTVLLVAAITFLLLVTTSYGESKTRSATAKWLNVLLVYIVVSVPFVQWPGSVLRNNLEPFIRAIVYFYFTVQLIDSIPRLRKLLFIFVGCQLFRVLEPLYLHETTGYWGDRAHETGSQFLARLSGAPADVINPNGLAFVILTILPFLHYFLGGSQRFILKLTYVLLLAPLMYAMILTGSRSGLIGLVFLYLFIILRSKHRLILGAAAVIAAIILVGVMTPQLKDRYLSIADRGTENLQTRNGRIEGVIRDFWVGLERPIFGHGLGTSREALVHAAGVDLLSHNLYTQVLIDLGVVGLSIYLVFLGSIFRNLVEAARNLRSLSAVPLSSFEVDLKPMLAFEKSLLALAITALVFSLAAYGLLGMMWYLIAGLSVVLRNFIRTRTVESAASGSAPALTAAGTEKSAMTRWGLYLRTENYPLPQLGRREE